MVLICLVLLSGCYTHIAWAKQWGVAYIVVPLPVSEWQKRVKHNGWPMFSIGAYLGEKYGIHWIMIRRDWCWEDKITGLWECNKYLVNHEVRHIRYPEWNHWMRGD